MTSDERVAQDDEENLGLVPAKPQKKGHKYIPDGWVAYLRSFKAVFIPLRRLIRAGHDIMTFNQPLFFIYASEPY